MTEDWHDHPVVMVAATRGIMRVQDHLIAAADLMVKVSMLDPHHNGLPVLKREEIKQALIHTWEVMEHLLVTIDDEAIDNTDDESMQSLADAQAIIRKNLASALEVVDE